MKISQVHTQIVNVPEAQSLAGVPLQPPVVRPFVTLRLETDEGIDGIAVSFTFYSKAMTNALKSAVHDLASLSIGENPLAPGPLLEKLRAAAGGSGPGGIFMLAFSAIDIALWDIRGKALNQPLWKLLGGGRQRLPAYASGVIQRNLSDAEAALAAHCLVEKGFRQIKMQLGLAGEHSPAKEVERARIVRESVGPGIKLMAESLETFGLKTTRGIAVVNDTVKDEELKRLDAAGVRGVRVNLAQGGGATWEMVIPLAKRFAAIGWHMQLNTMADDLFANRAVVSQVPCQIVFDHLGRLPQPAGIQHPAFGLICDLMHKEKAWVKLTGAYLLSKVGPPTYADSTVIAKAYVKEAPERLVWGSDWPHPTAPGPAKPNDAILLDLLAEWAPDTAVRNRILVDNPTKVYQFS